MNMKMNVIKCAVLAAVGLAGIAFAGGEGWSSDFAAAKKEAVESKKDILMNFTGSDWCGWCIKLNEEVFSKESYKTGTKDKFVPVEIDFPKDKSKLTEETNKQNEELGKKYGIEGYPTILLTDADGRPFAATGYKEGGPETYVKHLDELRARKTARDESFKTAEKANGIEKAKALVSALIAMELNDTIISSFYGDVVEQIKAADPKDETGFSKAAATKARIEKIQEDLAELAQKQDLDGALVLVDKTLKDGGLPSDETQELMATRGMIFSQQNKLDEAIKALDEAKAYAPESEIAAGFDGFKQRLEDEKKKAAGGDKSEKAEEK